MMLALMAWPWVAGRHLHVLRADRRDHVAGSEPVVVEPGRIQPDAHGVRRAEHLHVADARGAVERVEQVRTHVVGEILVAHAVVGGNEPDHDEEVARRFVDADAGLLHFLRKQRQCELQLVLHLHLRGVGHGALRERQRDGGAAVGITLRGHVIEVVDAVQLLLDHLHHGVLHRLRRGAGVVEADADLRRSQRRVLAHR